MIKIYNFLLNDFKNHKNRYLFITIFILLSCFLFENVSAFSLSDYESGISIFDDYTSDGGLPPCYAKYSDLHCNEGTIPNIRYAYENSDFKYYLRVLYIDKDTGITYYRFYLTTAPLKIRMNPSSSQYAIFYTTNDDSSFYYIKWSKSERITYYEASGQIDIFNSDDYDFSIATNYDLYYWDSDDIHTSATTGHEFYTDIDITIPKDNYVLLVPKKTVEFSSYLWTDSNFAYEELYYDKFNNTYSKVYGGGFNEISFGSPNSFNWFRWEFSFNDLDLSFNKVLMLYNHGQSDLHIKIHSSDFYHKLMSSNSSDLCVGDICYKNDYDNFKDFSYSTGSINNKYYVEDYDDGLSFIKEIPNIVKDFTKSFAFIGTLFTTLFTIFTGTISNYFYIIFGLMIIMLIIKILK